MDPNDRERASLHSSFCSVSDMFFHWRSVLKRRVSATLALRHGSREGPPFSVFACETLGPSPPPCDPSTHAKSTPLSVFACETLGPSPPPYVCSMQNSRIPLSLLLQHTYRPSSLLCGYPCKIDAPLCLCLRNPWTVPYKS